MCWKLIKKEFSNTEYTKMSLVFENIKDKDKQRYFIDVPYDLRDILDISVVHDIGSNYTDGYLNEALSEYEVILNLGSFKINRNKNKMLSNKGYFRYPKVPSIV